MLHAPKKPLFPHGIRRGCEAWLTQLTVHGKGLRTHASKLQKRRSDCQEEVDVDLMKGPDGKLKHRARCDCSIRQQLKFTDEMLMRCAFRAFGCGCSTYSTGYQRSSLEAGVT